MAEPSPAPPSFVHLPRTILGTASSPSYPAQTQPHPLTSPAGRRSAATRRSPGQFAVGVVSDMPVTRVRQSKFIPISFIHYSHSPSPQPPGSEALVSVDSCDSKMTPLYESIVAETDVAVPQTQFAMTNPVRPLCLCWGGRCCSLVAMR